MSKEERLLYLKEKAELAQRKIRGARNGTLAMLALFTMFLVLSFVFGIGYNSGNEAEMNLLVACFFIAGGFFFASLGGGLVWLVEKLMHSPDIEEYTIYLKVASSSKLVCSSCGKELPSSNFTFCPFCSAKLNLPTSEKTTRYTVGSDYPFSA